MNAPTKTLPIDPLLCPFDAASFLGVSGSIDTKACQGKIVDIMEGGAEAVERRKAIYQAWKGTSQTP